MGVRVQERDKGWYVIINWQQQRRAKYFGKNKALAKEFFWSGPPVPGSTDKAAKMRVRGAQAEHGWLQVALSQE